MTNRSWSARLMLGMGLLLAFHLLLHWYCSNYALRASGLDCFKHRCDVMGSHGMPLVSAEYVAWVRLIASDAKCDGIPVGAVPLPSKTEKDAAVAQGTEGGPEEVVDLLANRPMEMYRIFLDSDEFGLWRLYFCDPMSKSTIAFVKVSRSPLE